MTDLHEQRDNDSPDQGRRTLLKITGAGIAAMSMTSGTSQAFAHTAPTLSSEWDKTFPKSNDVDHQKVTFTNRYGITLAADLYQPKKAADKMPALAVSGPFGAVKEQSSGLYAQTMAERGFVTLAFDPSYTGESGGTPRLRHSRLRSVFRRRERRRDACRGFSRHQHRGLQRSGGFSRTATPG